MLKKLSVAALVAAMSVASTPTMISVAVAQEGANEPPKAPTPDDSMKGGDASKGDAMSSKSSMKKSKKHHMKKHM